MGWKYEVLAWKKYSDEVGYYYAEVYQGNSLIAAINAMRKAKRTSGCVRLEWR